MASWDLSLNQKGSIKGQLSTAEIASAMVPGTFFHATSIGNLIRNFPIIKLLPFPQEGGGHILKDSFRSDSRRGL